MKYLLLTLLLMSGLAQANKNLDSFDMVAILYSPHARVNGDSAEIDLNTHDDYSYFSLDSGILNGIRWVHRDKKEFFLEYFSIDAKNENGKNNVDQYQSLTVGLPIIKPKKINSFLDYFTGTYYGIGASRFSLGEEKYRANVDFSAEAGIRFSKRLSVSAGLKYQIVGYPSETMAEIWNVSVNVGVLF